MILKCKYRTGNGAAAGAKIKKGEPEPKINNFGSETLVKTRLKRC